MSDDQSPQEQQQGSRTVQVGGEEYKIAKFKGYKAFRIGRMLTALGEIGPEISKAVNAFIAEYREQNVDKISRATLEFRYPADAAAVSDEAWKEAGGVIELPQEPGQAEILAVVFPLAFEKAGDKVVDLLAWVVASDTELERKDDEGEQAVEQYIAGLRKTLLFRGDIDELFELATAAQEVLGEQMAGKGEQARSLLALVGLDGSPEEPETESQEEPEDRDPEEESPKAASPEFEETPSDGETPSTQESPTMSERPDSSTDSPAPTDGPEERSSTAPAGEPSPSISG